jgi:WhiB family redox-sensing transcriptional regulator
LRAVQQIPDEYAWMLRGSCRGADTREFFPSNGLGVEAAQQICRQCPVQEECLEYALQNHIEQGVWGGASERERRRILRRRRRAAALGG